MVTHLTRPAFGLALARVFVFTQNPLLKPLLKEKASLEEQQTQLELSFLQQVR